jgi:hypothetical protein
MRWTSQGPWETDAIKGSGELALSTLLRRARPAVVRRKEYCQTGHSDG